MIIKRNKQSRMDRKTLLSNTLTTSIFLGLATAISGTFFVLTKNTTNVAIFYMLAVMFIARYTDGYVPGMIASVFAVICVNFVFTYPYLALNFAIDGYPVTFIGMLVIASITSTMTTHLKVQNRILNEREKLLMEAEKEKMRANLLRAISHDIRTPLTSIIGTSSTYLENADTIPEEDKIGMLKNIYEDSNWLLNMVENLLAVTRIREEGTHVTTSLEPLEEVVSEAVARFKKRLPLTEVQVSIPDDFIMIPVDATLIEQVIINLLENAVYHSNSDKPLELKVITDNRYVWFHIIDYGIGISEDLLENIFDGYSSAPNFSGDSRKGMGIGLSICKTIILAHDGDIKAQNHENGACFTFSLPLGENNTYES